MPEIYEAQKQPGGDLRIVTESRLGFQRALQRHAYLTWVEYRIMRYPSEPSDLYRADELKLRPVFSYHFFAADGREVGYWHPDLGVGQIFDEPRPWHPDMKAPLEVGHD